MHRKYKIYYINAHHICAYAYQSSQRQTCIPVGVEGGIHTAHTLVERAAVSTRLGVLPLKYLALTPFKPVVARALVWIHAHTVAHALLPAGAVVTREIALLARVNDVEQTCVGSD